MAVDSLESAVFFFAPAGPRAEPSRRAFRARTW
jgi:hypothetical protein